ncbi:hypothetical protein GGU11DRAFT_750742, partial [Lentinula aff. detonsa]
MDTDPISAQKFLTLRLKTMLSFSAFLPIQLIVSSRSMLGALGLFSQPGSIVSTWSVKGAHSRGRISSRRGGNLVSIRLIIFTDKDFAPSIPSSTQARFPESFPTRLPRAPDASSDDALFDPDELDRREERMDGGGENGESDGDEVPSAENPFSALSSRMPHAVPPLPTPSPAFSRQTRSQTSQPSRTPTPSSSLTTIHTPSSRHDRELERLRVENARLRADNAGLMEESASLKAQRDAAQVHAVFAGQQYAVYKHRLHEKTKRKEGSKRVSTSARVLTSMQG